MPHFTWDNGFMGGNPLQFGGGKHINKQATGVKEPLDAEYLNRVELAIQHLQWRVDGILDNRGTVELPIGEATGMWPSGAVVFPSGFGTTIPKVLITQSGCPVMPPSGWGYVNAITSIGCNIVGPSGTNWMWLAVA